jgi:hypothetical protein
LIFKVQELVSRIRRSAGLEPERIGRFGERSEYEADRSGLNPVRQTTTNPHIK